jgi:hypothetical protein
MTLVQRKRVPSTGAPFRFSPTSSSAGGRRQLRQSILASNPQVAMSANVCAGKVSVAKTNYRLAIRIGENDFVALGAANSRGWGITGVLELEARC